MNTRSTLAFFGGDRRMAVAAEEMKKRGYSAETVVGFSADSGTEREKIQTVIARSDVLVLPIPCSIDGRTIAAPSAEFPVDWKEICMHLTSRHRIIGGRIPDDWRAEAVRCGVMVYDAAESDRFAWKNALPTAEGALAIAIQTVPKTVSGMCVLLIGYGRIHRCLAPMLLSLGAHVTVCERKPEARELAAEIGCEVIAFSHLSEACGNADWICNSVPACILGEKELSHCKEDVLLLDLASKPGGVDRAEAEKQGISVIWALGLPGKCAPVSAGRYYAEEILEILCEGEEKQ